MPDFFEESRVEILLSPAFFALMLFQARFPFSVSAFHASALLSLLRTSFGMLSSLSFCFFPSPLRSPMCPPTPLSLPSAGPDFFFLLVCGVG